MPPKPNWAGINHINAIVHAQHAQLQPLAGQRRQAHQQNNPAPVARAHNRAARIERNEPQGPIRGGNGHLVRANSWVFTLFLSQEIGAINYIDPTGPNPNDYWIPPLETIRDRFRNPFAAPRGHRPVYISYQLELGNNGDPLFGERYHYQGYIEFQDAVTAEEIVDMMGIGNNDHRGWWNWDMEDIYLASRKSSQDAAQRYTHKDDTVVYMDDLENDGEYIIRRRIEEGAMRNQQPNVWEHMNQMINDGAGYNELVDAYPRQALMAASGLTKKIMERLKMNPPPFRHVKVYVFWGDTRTGKTRKVYDLEGSDRVYSKTDDSLYFDGYDSSKHKVLLLDEVYSGSGYKHGNLLHWLQGHPHLLNQKFGGAYANWDKVYITSNNPPRTWFPAISTAQSNALYKRYETGGIVKFVDTNDPVSVRDHNEEVELNLNKRDRPYVMFTAVPV